MNASKPTIAITMGDPAGIGPELCLRALVDPGVAAMCTPAVIGDAALLARVATLCGLPPPARVVPLDEWRRGGADGGGGACVVDCGALRAEAVEPGRVSAECGRAAYAYVEEAVRSAQAQRVAAIATAPLNKEALHLAGVPHPGHTEILAALTNTPRVAMMLACEELAVSLVTIHVSLAAVPGLLTTEAIIEVAMLTVAALRRLGRERPRLVVCGLNPHAGEQGLFGSEEIAIITPAVAALRARGVCVTGPLPPDTAFLPERRRETDAYIAMYHDQGLIPLKMLAFDRAVNITLGLPIVRTSVDHGTAFDIAWQGKASPNSLFEAIHWAARLSARR
jgi:4-hydroxythreonine-4-phosphate dehydrogenase